MNRFFFPLLVIILLSSCADRRMFRYGAGEAPMRIAGSSTMELLLRKWSEAYVKKNPDAAIVIESTSTGDGVQSLIRGYADICAASRPLLPAESKQMIAQRRSMGFVIRCAKDALSIYVHPSNPVTSLTLRQAKDIFTGAVTSWEEVGGTNVPILVFVRERESGTATFLKEHLLFGEEYTSLATVSDGTESIVRDVALHPNAIGFGGIAYGLQLRHLEIDGVQPSAEYVRNDTYPLSRYLYFFTVAQPQNEMRDFINWTVSEEGQRIADEAGFIPLYRKD